MGRSDLPDWRRQLAAAREHLTQVCSFQGGYGLYLVSHMYLCDLMQWDAIHGVNNGKHMVPLLLLQNLMLRCQQHGHLSCSRRMHSSPNVTYSEFEGDAHT